jgi:two-component system, chemotaxis family, response regulator Rcp1
MLKGQAVQRPIRFLVVESNAADAYLMVEALKQDEAVEITVIDDGQQALANLLEEQRSPDVIFLDLNVTPVSGLEILAQVRSNPKLRCIPVVVISGSRNTEDVRRAYQLGANCFITKPGSLDQFLQCMKSCHEFWAATVTLPPKSTGE